MEKARRKAVRLRKAENSSDNIDKVYISLSDVTAVDLIVIQDQSMEKTSVNR